MIFPFFQGFLLFRFLVAQTKYIGALVKIILHLEIQHPIRYDRIPMIDLQHFVSHIHICLKHPHPSKVHKDFNKPMVTNDKDPHNERSFRTACALRKIGIIFELIVRVLNWIPLHHSIITVMSSYFPFFTVIKSLLLALAYTPRTNDLASKQ